MSPKILGPDGQPAPIVEVRKSLGFVPQMLKAAEPESLTGVAPPHHRRWWMWNEHTEDQS